jgi:hypothetical protein
MGLFIAPHFFTRKARSQEEGYTRGDIGISGVTVFEGSGHSLAVRVVTQAGEPQSFFVVD